MKFSERLSLVDTSLSAIFTAIAGAELLQNL